MLIHRYQVSNNYWKVDYGKQKGTGSISADAKDRSRHLRGLDRGLLYQPFENVVQVTYKNRITHRRDKDYPFVGREAYKGTQNLTMG